jgi:GntR family transcriptional regulator
MGTSGSLRVARPETRINQVADGLRQRILAGEFGDSGQLPTEGDLIRSSGTSLTTVRSAYRQLITEGLVVSIPRTGYYVHLIRPIELRLDSYERAEGHNWDGVHDQWEAEVLRQGRVPTAEVTVELFGGDHPAPSDIEQGLGLEHGASILLRARRCYVDGIRWMDRPSWFPRWICAGNVLEQPGDHSAPGGLLASIGYHVATWEDTYRARMPRPDEIESLKLFASTPGIDWTRIRRDVHGQPLAVMRSFCAADRVILHRVDQAS